MTQPGSPGGRSRAAKLTHQRRQEIARHAAHARFNAPLDGNTRITESAARRVVRSYLAAALQQDPPDDERAFMIEAAWPGLWKREAARAAALLGRNLPPWEAPRG